MQRFWVRIKKKQPKTNAYKGNFLIYINKVFVAYFHCIVVERSQYSNQYTASVAFNVIKKRQLEPHLDNSWLQNLSVV